MEYVKKCIIERKKLRDSKSTGHVIVVMETSFEPATEIYVVDGNQKHISPKHVKVEISLMSGNKFHENLMNISEYFDNGELDANGDPIPPQDSRDYYNYISNYEIAIEEMKILAREQRR